MTGRSAERRTRTNIVRTRTGCQNCRTRRRKCDETRPECLRCVGRGIKCSGYQRTLAFKDVSAVTARSSQKSEAARWAALRRDDDRRRLNRPCSPSGQQQAPGFVETLSGDDGSEESSPPVRDPGGPSHAEVRPAATSATTLPWENVLDGWASAGQPEGARGELELSDDSSSWGSRPLDWGAGSALESTESPIQYTGDLIPLDMEVQHAEEPVRDCLAQRTQEESLISYFQSRVLCDLPVQFTFGREYMENTCFRHAVMALSSVHLSCLGNNDDAGGNRPHAIAAMAAAGREHYLAAVRELHKRLDLSEERSCEQHAAAALMLAYYEIETGSPFGSMRHARGVDALLSKMDSMDSILVSMPEVFKAWRLLRYDVKFICVPYRETTLAVDAHDPYNILDPQLAIRDIFSQLWHLHGRVSMEAAFACGPGGPSGPGHASPSQQAAFWIRSVLNRECDRKNCERGDYHKDSLTAEMITQKCERLTRRMDQWHASSVENHPVASLGVAQPFIHRSSFEPFAPLRFASDRKAHEYMLYVSARLIASYLQSALGNAGSSAATTEAWARTLLGIVCGLEKQAVGFTYVQTDLLLGLAALLCEGSRTIDAVIEGVIPHVHGAGIRKADLPEWVYLQKVLEVARAERMKGKAIRWVCIGLDEDYERRQYKDCCSWAAFGDYNGKGYFRECYTFEN